MTPSRHAAISLGLGLMLWWATASFMSLALSVIAGFLIDLDHLTEYFRFRFTGKSDKLFIILHSYELLPIIWAIGLILNVERAAMVVTIGFLSHLAADILAYGSNPLVYSFCFRASRGFDFKRLAPQKRPSRKKMTELKWVSSDPRNWWNYPDDEE